MCDDDDGSVRDPTHDSTIAMHPPSSSKDDMHTRIQQWMWWAVVASPISRPSTTSVTHTTSAAHMLYTTLFGMLVGSSRDDDAAVTSAIHDLQTLVRTIMRRLVSDVIWTCIGHRTHRTKDTTDQWCDDIPWLGLT